jgi:hypothetical protein
VGDRVQLAVALVDDGCTPAVPRRHVGGERGQRFGKPALPQQTEIREEHRLLDTEVGKPPRARRRLPVVVGQCFVIAILGRQPLATSFAVPTDRDGVAGKLNVGQLDALIAPGEPRVTEVVVDNAQGVVS